MNGRFDGLRAALVAVILVGCTLAVVGVAAGPVAAEQATLPLDVETAGVVWEVGEDLFGNVFPGASAFYIVEATRVDRGDAYDGAFALLVNGIPFHAPGGIVDLTTDAKGTTLSVGPVTLGGLKVRASLRFFEDVPGVRVLYSFTNPATAAREVRALVGTNLGSDEFTRVEGTSAGRTTASATDAWIATSDDVPNFDVLNTLCRQSKAKTVAISLLLPGRATTAEGLETRTSALWDAFTFTVAPGETKRLLFFGFLAFDAFEAIAFGRLCNNRSTLSAAGLLDGLNASQRAQLLNY